MKKVITKDMTFNQVLRIHKDVAGVLAEYHLGCIGCLGAEAESLEQGCRAHGLDVDELVRELNEILN